MVRVQAQGEVAHIGYAAGQMNLAGEVRSRPRPVAAIRRVVLEEDL